jgi:adenylyltransferase/sulfurtransferase
MSDPFMLSQSHQDRFSRHLRLPGFGEKQQMMLQNAHVLVIGLGGLGNPVAHFLAAAGVGKLTLMDWDKIELHNLHRQLLFATDDTGKGKAETAARKLSNQYPNVSVDFRNSRFSEEDSTDFPHDVQLIADCTDNIPTRYAIDRKASEMQIPVMFGAVHQMEGQISLFHGSARTRYTDVYPSPPTSPLVLGPVAGIIGSMMATSIIQYIAFGHTRADGRLIRYDGNLQELFSTQIEPATLSSMKGHIQPVHANEIERLLQDKTIDLWIDVRELHDHPENNLGGICRPAGDVLLWFDEPHFAAKVLLYCNHGIQSFAAAHVLADKRPDLKIHHLKDGLRAISEERHIRSHRA